MSKNGSHLGNKKSLHDRLNHPFINAVNAGVIRRHRDKNYGGIRQDVPETEKRICIIKSDNGRDLVKSWVGHFPNNPDKYRIHREKEGEIIILTRIDVWQKTANKNIWPDFFKKIVSEYEARKQGIF